jgi:hypothetical protein
MKRFHGHTRGAANSRAVEARLVVEAPVLQRVEGFPGFLLERIRLTIEPGDAAAGEVEESSLCLGRWQALKLGFWLVIVALRARRTP